MIVLRRVFDLKHNCNLRIKELDIKSGEIGLGVEDQPVCTTGKWLFNQKERLHSPVFVGPRVTKFGPTFVCVLEIQTDSHASGGRATRYIKYVRGDGAHPR